MRLPFHWGSTKVGDMKIFCSIGVLLFTLFAYWQMNDLVEYGNKWWQGWLLTYLMTALVCLISFFKALPKWCYWGGAGAALLHALLRSVSIQPEETILFNGDNPAGNETGGLVIVCMWFISLALWRKKTLH